MPTPTVCLSLVIRTITASLCTHDDAEALDLARQAGELAFRAGMACADVEIEAPEIVRESGRWSSLVDGWYDARAYVV